MQKEKETISRYGEGRSLVHDESKQENTIEGFVELLALVSWVLKALTQFKTKSQMNRTQVNQGDKNKSHSNTWNHSRRRTDYTYRKCGTMPKFIRGLFQMRNTARTYDLRGSRKLVIPYVNTTTYGLHSFRYTSVNM